MKPLRKFLAGTSITGVTLALGLAGLISAAPANAATFPVTASCSGGEFVYSANNFSAGVGDVITVTNSDTAGMGLIGSSGVTIITGGGPSANQEIDAGQTRSYTVNSASGGFIDFSDNGIGSGPCLPVTVPTTRITFTSGGGGGSSSSSTPAPAVFEMTFAPADGTVCTTRSESATVGSWIGLPAANQCTPPVARPNAKLLGWATTPDFPLSIAQRQVDNGWGAYEIFNNEGRLTAVFIPAGRATQVSSPASL